MTSKGDESRELDDGVGGKMVELRTKAIERHPKERVGKHGEAPLNMGDQHDALVLQRSWLDLPRVQTEPPLPRDDPLLRELLQPPSRDTRRNAIPRHASGYRTGARGGGLPGLLCILRFGCGVSRHRHGSSERSIVEGKREAEVKAESGCQSPNLLYQIANRRPDLAPQISGPTARDKHHAEQTLHMADLVRENRGAPPPLFQLTHVITASARAHTNLNPKISGTNQSD